MRVILLLLVVSLLGASGAAAQSWSSASGRPALWQITSVDASGETPWPYGAEDVAGDGAATFEDDEAGADLRTVYAHADAERLWLRAYVASETAVAENAIVYFFLDTDAQRVTGGDAASSALWPELEADPTLGGYERVIAASGDGSLVGAWRWDTTSDAWMEIDAQPNDIGVELERDVDPIRLGAVERGYAQVDVDHAITTLDASCDSNVFVRIRHDAMPMRSFSDDDDEAWVCRSSLDELGDPVVLDEPACTDDDDCPGDGECVDDVCRFTYACSGDDDCPEGESCDSGRCVDDGSGGTGGSGGSGGSGGTSGSGGTGGSGGAGGTPPGNVQGGAFHCSAPSSGAAAATPCTWSLLFVLMVLYARRRV